MKKFIITKSGYLLFLLIIFIGSSKPIFATERTPDENENVPFVLSNMFPGDSFTQEFVVKTQHSNPLTLSFHVEIRPGYEVMAEVLKFKVVLPEKNILLYEGLLIDIPNVLDYLQPANEKEIKYRIEASLDTSVGNEYQSKELIADFSWWYTQESSGSGGGGGQRPPENPPSLEVTSPKTGDENNLTIYMVLGTLSLTIIIFMLLLKKRGEEERNG